MSEIVVPNYKGYNGKYSRIVLHLKELGRRQGNCRKYVRAGFKVIGFTLAFEIDFILGIGKFAPLDMYDVENGDEENDPEMRKLREALRKLIADPPL